MASKNGLILSRSKREMLLKELTAAGELTLEQPPPSRSNNKRRATSNKRKQGQQAHQHPAQTTAANRDSKPPAVTTANNFGTGCLACGTDDDHANLMLCEGCNDEYHTYCLEPPLRSVPTGDWYCDNCKPIYDVLEEDGLDQKICTLPPSFTSRFGEICWAQGGVGFGWWPACIYDPRLTVGNARQLARKNLGKRHLVYFFECHNAPFAVLNNARLIKWDDGLVEDYHLGRTARAVGKARGLQFAQALQAAIIEYGKPIEQRLEWNHTSDMVQLLPSPRKSALAAHKSTEHKKRQRSGSTTAGATTEDKSSVETDDSEIIHDNRPSKRSVGFALTASAESASNPFAVLSREKLEDAIRALKTANAANQIEMNEDGELYCSVVKKKSGVSVTTDEYEETIGETIGFIRLASRKTSTFADAREGIMNDLDLDYIPANGNWKFFVPVLGPVSSKQERSLGPVLSFLQQTTSDARLGEGTIRRPLKLVIIEDPLKSQG